MTKVSATLVFSGLLLATALATHADVNIPGMGSGAYDVPSVGGPGDKVDKAPTCDTQSRPKITKVKPDPVSPGQKITIKGENFGSKECFKDVSFGASGGTRNDGKIDFQYVDESTVEATVPDLKPGLAPVNVITAGGSSQSILLIQSQDAQSKDTTTTGQVSDKKTPSSIDDTKSTGGKEESSTRSSSDQGQSTSRPPNKE